MEALRERIGKAYRDKQTFRVIVVMPLLPSFNGESIISYACMDPLPEVCQLLGSECFRVNVDPLPIQVTLVTAVA